MQTSETIQAAMIGAAAALAQALAAASTNELEGTSVGQRQEWLMSAFDSIYEELEEWHTRSPD